MRTKRSAQPMVLLAALTILVTTGGVLAEPTFATEGEGAHPGLIVYASNVDGDYELFVMRPDGTHVRQLTHNRIHDYDMSWSPNGRRIVFEREDKDYYEDIYILRTNGGPAKRWMVAPAGQDLGDPAWSPDGKWIALRGNDGGDGSDVLAYTVDKTEGTTISWQEEDSVNSDPAWSPDGTHVAVAESYDFEGDIVIGDCCDTFHKEQLTSDSPEERALDWSPDGSCLVYSRYGDTGYDLYVVSVDATEPRLLLDGARDVVAASWSPDGTEILFYGKANRGYELYVMNADGTDVRALTSTRGVSEITPDWYAPPSDVEPVAPDCA